MVEGECGEEHWWREVDTDEEIGVETLHAWNLVMINFVIYGDHIKE